VAHIDADLLSLETLRPLKRSEYDRLVELGVFADEKVELLYGMLVRMSPQGTRHAFVIRTLLNRLVTLLAGRALVQAQSPIAASDESEPEPDVAVVEPGPYLTDHPSTAHLVVEVADSSLAKDVRLKARLYAQTGIPEYWVVDLENDAVVVHRDPMGDGYRDVRTVRRGDSLRLLAFPDVSIAVTDVLPPGG
jgi:Uma2 family endonuclease